MVYVILKVLSLDGGSLGNALSGHMVFELRKVAAIGNAGG